MREARDRYIYRLDGPAVLHSWRDLIMPYLLRLNSPLGSFAPSSSIHSPFLSFPPLPFPSPATSFDFHSLSVPPSLPMISTITVCDSCGRILATSTWNIETPAPATPATPAPVSPVDGEQGGSFIPGGSIVPSHHSDRTLHCIVLTSRYSVPCWLRVCRCCFGKD